jgi:uncharacterized protein
MELFAVPVLDKYLVYAPLNQTAALINHGALTRLRAGRESGVHPDLDALCAQLGSVAVRPLARSGPITDPIFLGIIPTRGCNMTCRYCDFVAPQHAHAPMTLETARAAVDAYLDLLDANHNDLVEIHFFGGEPFSTKTVVSFVVEYATYRAAEQGRLVHFEATTNGFFDENYCRWIAHHFDTIVLSLDGPPDIQNRQRPVLNDQPSADVVIRNAQVFSDAPVDLVIRACVTDYSVERLPEIAHWIGTHFRPSTVCLETLTPSPLSAVHGLEPPDPWLFAREFDRAAQILKPYGIDTVISTADLRTCRVSFCPVGKDALIVSPDGSVNTCYLLPHDWIAAQLNMQIGRLTGATFEFDHAAVQAARDLNVYQKTLCEGCLCRYHCAGGCHVNHTAIHTATAYDSLCVQTRLITVAQLLRSMQQHDLADRWLADPTALERTVRYPSDRLIDQRVEA